MHCKECHNVIEINENYYTECEIHGKCSLGEVVVEYPEEKLDIFKKTNK